MTIEEACRASSTAELLRSRRTHGAFRTEDEALHCAHNLNRLLNGTPCGYAMLLGRRMGAFVLYSCRIDALNRANEASS